MIPVFILLAHFILATLVFKPIAGSKRQADKIIAAVILFFIPFIGVAIFYYLYGARWFQRYEE